MKDILGRKYYTSKRIKNFSVEISKAEPDILHLSGYGFGEYCGRWWYQHASTGASLTDQVKLLNSLGKVVVAGYWIEGDRKGIFRVVDICDHETLAIIMSDVGYDNLKE